MHGGRALRHVVLLLAVAVVVQAGKPEALTDRVIVKFASGALTQGPVGPMSVAGPDLASLGLAALPGGSAAAPGASRSKGVAAAAASRGVVGVYKITDKQGVEQKVAQLKAHRNVQWAEPVHVRRALETSVFPNDPRLSRVWWLTAIRAPQSWAMSTGSTGIRACIVDTGAMIGHEDLSNVVTGWNRAPTYDDYGNVTYGSDNNYADGFGHGSHVSGIVGATGNNGKGVAGVNWRLTMAACKALDDNGMGDDWSIKLCLDECRLWGANVVSASIGGAGFSATVHDAVADLQAAGALFVAAAGNDGEDQDALDPLVNRNYPSGYGTSTVTLVDGLGQPQVYGPLDNVVAVAATDRPGNMADYSNYGKTTVHLAAPGSCVYSCVSLSTSSYASMSGTSMATPVVSGSAALLMAAASAAGQPWTYLDIKNALLATVDPQTVSFIDTVTDYTGYTISGGKLNLERALARLLGTSEAQTPWTGVATPSPGQRFAFSASTSCTYIVFTGNFDTKQSCINACLKDLQCKYYVWTPDGYSSSLTGGAVVNCQLFTKDATYTSITSASAESGSVNHDAIPQPSPPSPPPSPPLPSPPPPNPNPPPSPPAPAGSISNVRLVGGSSPDEGRVEVEIDGSWGTVCSDNFLYSSGGAKVVCRMLGLPTSGARPVDNLVFGGNDLLPILLDECSCTGSEPTLNECTCSRLNDCTHDEDVGVVCSDGVRPNITDVRLVNGETENEGRVEVLIDGEWGTVCDDRFDRNNNAAQVVCRMLGMGGGDVRNKAYFGEGSLPILVDEVNCAGNESSLNECYFDTVSDCVHSEDVGVVCDPLVPEPPAPPTPPPDAPPTDYSPPIFPPDSYSPPIPVPDGYSPPSSTSDYSPPSPPPYPPNPPPPKLPPGYITRVRLVNGSFPGEGRLEVEMSGQWGTTCQDVFDQDNNAAEVVCRMLGLDGTRAQPAGSAHFGEGTLPIRLDEVSCLGTEDNINACNFTRIPDCEHYEDIGVICDTSMVTIADMRLVNGDTPAEGRLEVRINRQWFTVCDDAFDDNAAQVVCRALGLRGGRALGSAYYGSGAPLPIGLDEVTCTGTESSLTECSKDFVHDCSHSEDVGVLCESVDSPSPVDSPPADDLSPSPADNGPTPSPTDVVVTPGPADSPPPPPPLPPTPPGLTVQHAVELTFNVTATSCNADLLAGFKTALAAALGVDESRITVNCALAGASFAPASVSMAAPGPKKAVRSAAKPKHTRGRGLLAQALALKATVRQPTAQAAQRVQQQVLAKVDQGTFTQQVMAFLPPAVKQVVSEVGISHESVSTNDFIVPVSPSPANSPNAGPVPTPLGRSPASGALPVGPPLRVTRPGIPVLLSKTAARSTASIKVKPGARALSHTINCTPRVKQISRSTSKAVIGFRLAGLRRKTTYRCNIYGVNAAGKGPALTVTLTTTK